MSMSKLTRALNNYDPYGIMRVNSLQGVFITITALIINLVFMPPHMTAILSLGIGLLASVGMETNFSKRPYTVVIFGGLCVVYSLLLSLVQNYQLLMIAMMGIFIGGLFALSRRFPILATMILMVHLNVYTSLVLPKANWYIYCNYMLTVGLITIIVITAMSFFPRVYYIRVWLRSVYLTLEEFEHNFYDLVQNGNQIERQVFKHFLKMNGLTLALSYRDCGFAARRVNIALINLHAVFSLVANRLEEFGEPHLIQIASYCGLVKQAISAQASVRMLDFAPENEILLRTQADLQQLSRSWNSICCKI